VSTRLDDAAVRALLGAALLHPPLAAFVGISLDTGEIADDGPLTTVALVVAVNHDNGEFWGVEGAAEILTDWGELDRVGGREFLEELTATRPDLEAKVTELRTRLANLPAIDAEPIVRVAAELLGAELVTDVPPGAPASA
jgi:hypothetical protein